MIMFAHFGGVHLLLLTAVVVARAHVPELPHSEDAISGSEIIADKNQGQDGIYQDIQNYATGTLVDNHLNFKPRNFNFPSPDQNFAPGVNSVKNHKSFGSSIVSSSDHNNEAALGDGFFEFSVRDKELFDNEKVLPKITDLNQADLHENPREREVREDNDLPSGPVGADGGVRNDEQFRFQINYTIDVSDMSLACQENRVNLNVSASRLFMTLNRVLRMFPELREKYANWAYDASWEEYSHLIRADLDARYVPLLPLLPDEWIRQRLSPSSPIQPEPDAVTSLDQVLQDTYSVMELCKAAADSVLLEQALFNYPLIDELTDLNGELERVLGILWNILDKCNVDPNPEPLQHILELVYERGTLDDSKRRGFLTIHHTEKALQYVHDILKAIDPSLERLS